jgi:hypothetical protein
VTLKVGGSNPSIHPVITKNSNLQFWEVIPADFNYNRDSIKWTKLNTRFALIKFILTTWGQPLLSRSCNTLLWDFLWNKSVYKQPTDLFKSNFLKQDFKFLGSSNSIDSLHQKALPINAVVGCSVHFDVKLLNTFRSFTLNNMSSPNTLFKPHASFSSFYISQAKGGSILLNVGKFFQKWKLAYFLLFNLFYYKIKLLVFAQSFFKVEALAINWSEGSQLSFMWRYIQPFLTYRATKIHHSCDFLFRKLKYLGLSTCIVVNPLYHRNTLYYLRRLNFYSIGLLPSNYASNSLDFCIAITNQSILGELWFVRFALNTKKIAMQQRLNLLRGAWSDTN